MIVRAMVEPRPSDVPQAPREVVVDAPTYAGAVAQIDAEVAPTERVMYYRVDDAEHRWNPPR